MFSQLVEKPSFVGNQVWDQDQLQVYQVDVQARRQVRRQVHSQVQLQVYQVDRQVRKHLREA